MINTTLNEIIPVDIRFRSMTRLLISPAANAPKPWLKAIVRKKLAGMADIQAETPTLLVKSRPWGVGNRPSLIICAMMIINPAVTNDVKIPNTCLTSYKLRAKIQFCQKEP